MREAFTKRLDVCFFAGPTVKEGESSHLRGKGTKRLHFSRGEVVLGNLLAIKILSQVFYVEANLSYARECAKRQPAGMRDIEM